MSVRVLQESFNECIFLFSVQESKFKETGVLTPEEVRSTEIMLVILQGLL